MKIISGYWQIQAEEKAAFIDLCHWVSSHSKNESGYISYFFTQDMQNENSFLFLEEWKDQKSIDFHVSQWYFIEFMKKVKPMLLTPAIIKIYSVNNVEIMNV